MIEIKIAVLDGEVKSYLLEGPMPLWKALNKIRFTIDFDSQEVTLNRVRILDSKSMIDNQDRITIVNK